MGLDLGQYGTVVGGRGTNTFVFLFSVSCLSAPFNNKVNNRKVIIVITEKLRDYNNRKLQKMLFIN